MADALETRWTQLLAPSRRKKEKESGAAISDSEETRTEIERDYDRILFSTPVRRLADKTQVFPLEKNDSVRTRLTHSHEVSRVDVVETRDWLMALGIAPAEFMARVLWWSPPAESDF